MRAVVKAEQDARGARERGRYPERTRHLGKDGRGGRRPMRDDRAAGCERDRAACVHRGRCSEASRCTEETASPMRSSRRTDLSSCAGR